MDDVASAPFRNHLLVICALLLGTSLGLAVYFVAQPSDEEYWNRDATPEIPLPTHESAQVAATTPHASSAFTIAGELYGALLRQILKLEQRHDWSGVPECVRHHLRRFLAAQMLLEAPDSIHRPAATAEGWTGSPLGFGSNRVYVISYNKFRHRQRELNESMARYKLPEAHMVEWWEAPYVDLPRIENDTQLFDCFWPFREPGSDPTGATRDRAISTRESSLWLKHVTAYYHALLFDLAPITVLEDDAVFVTKSMDVWPSAFAEAPPNWALLFPGSCINIHGRVTHGKYLSKQRRGRCGHGYMISALGMITAFKGVSKHPNKPIDHYHNMLCGDYPEGGCYWMEPHMVEQVPSSKHHEQDTMGNSRL